MYTQVDHTRVVDVRLEVKVKGTKSEAAVSHVARKRLHDTFML